MNSLSSRAALAAAALAVPLVVTGCAHGPKPPPPPPPLWPIYEHSLHVMWDEPEAFDVGEQIQTLEDAVAAARADGRKVPPGMQAHIGHLHAKAGDRAAATAWFQAEKASFPDAAVLMDRLIAGAAR